MKGRKLECLPWYSRVFTYFFCLKAGRILQSVMVGSFVILSAAHLSGPSIDVGPVCWNVLQSVVSYFPCSDQA